MKQKNKARNYKNIHSQASKPVLNAVFLSTDIAEFPVHQNSF